MISLTQGKDYFILIDGQGASFGAGRVFEGIKEVAEHFQTWADADGYSDPQLIGWTIGDCLSSWVFELKYYNGIDFVEAPEKFISYEITK